MVVEAGPAEKLPPHDIEAEEAIIASLMVDPEAIYKIAPVLKTDDFFREKNAWAFEAVWPCGSATSRSTRSPSPTSWPAAGGWRRSAARPTLAGWSQTCQPLWALSTTPDSSSATHLIAS